MARPTTQYILLFLVVAFAIVHAFPQNNHNNNRKNGYDEIEPIPSATGHHGHHNGRVQIKVYRGQSKHHGHGWGESFAPYGYWVRQPPDNHGHHHGGY